MPVPKYFLDTNIFLRPIAKDSPAKVKDCEALLTLIKNRRLKAVTSNLIFAEFVWTCQSLYGLSKPLISECLKRILNYKNIQISDRFQPKLALDLWQKKKIKFIDALIASDVRIKNKQLIIISYDKDFDKIGVIRQEPQDIIKNFE